MPTCTPTHSHGMLIVIFVVYTPFIQSYSSKKPVLSSQCDSHLFQSQSSVNRLTKDRLPICTNFRQNKVAHAILVPACVAWLYL